MPLYIISTPIGNLKDITLRAIETLQTVDILLCEDTRKTGFLLKSLPVISSTPSSPPTLLAFNSFNENSKTSQIVELLKQGKKVGLVSNAGTPLVADPGFRLVREAVGQGIEVISVPGASSILCALTSSGLPTNRFCFMGFLPKKEAGISKTLNDISSVNFPCVFIFFESPHRIVKTVSIFNKLNPEMELTIANELTKLYEKVQTKRVGEWLKFFEDNKPRGEFVILVSPKGASRIRS